MNGMEADLVTRGDINGEEAILEIRIPIIADKMIIIEATVIINIMKTRVLPDSTSAASVKDFRF